MMTLKVPKFFGVLTLGIVIGAGGLIFLSAHGVFASAADNYNACLQDAKIGLLEYHADDRWFDKAMAQCAQRYRIDREHGR